MVSASVNVLSYSTGFSRSCVSHGRGEVTEWPNVAVSKTVGRASVPWVQIPPSPPVYNDYNIIHGEMLEFG
jgi:hypothetical protein